MRHNSRRMVFKLKYSPMTILFLLIALSCGQPAFLSEQELKEYILEENSGLNAKKQLGNIQMQVTYRPTDLLILQELDDASNLTEINELREKYENYLYFILSLSVGGKDLLYRGSSNQQDFSNKLQTLSFGMGPFVSLITSEKDTIPVADYRFDRSFGLGSSSSLLFVFPREEIKNATKLSFQTQEFGFGTGTQDFIFDRDKLDNHPRVKEIFTSKESLSKLTP